MTIAEARKQIAGDAFLEFAVRDIIRKGTSELDAITAVINTYGPKDNA
jgi:cytochrome c-type biogenesis protein CcmH/NrfF